MVLAVKIPYHLQINQVTLMTAQKETGNHLLNIIQLSREMIGAAAVGHIQCYFLRAAFKIADLGIGNTDDVAVTLECKVRFFLNLLVIHIQLPHHRQYAADIGQIRHIGRRTHQQNSAQVFQIRSDMYPRRGMIGVSELPD